MLKKNIAKTMAAATMITAAAPMVNVVFADVIDSTQDEAIKNLKERVYEKFNAKYTLNKALLSVTDLAGEYAYNKVTIQKNGTGEGTECSSYAEFVKYFDKMFAELNNGEHITVTYNSETPVRELEDGTLVDFKEVKYTADNPLPEEGEEPGTNEGEGQEPGTNEGEGQEPGTSVRTTSTTYKYTEVVRGRLTDGTEYAKIRLSDENGKARYTTVKVGDLKLDLEKPQFRVVDGYYVDAKGNSIKKFNPLTVITDMPEVKSLGGVIDGFYLDTTEKADLVEAKDSIEKNATALTKKEVTTAELFEVSTDRLTKLGNELKKAIIKVEEEAVEQPDEYKNKVTVFGTNKAGQKVEGAELNDKDKIDSLENIKVIFEQRENKNADFTPVYEFTITNVRGTEYTHVIDHVLGAQDAEIKVAAGLDRYQTAVEVSKQGWQEDVTREGEAETTPISKDVVLVSGANDKLVDGLTATPLAAALNDGDGAPVLLTKKDEIPTEVIEELERLGAKNVYIVGGVNSVSTEVQQVLAKTYKLNVIRVAGDDKYETSLAVAERLQAIKQKELQSIASKAVVNGTYKFDEVFVVGGNGMADALSASAIAGHKGAPILLTKADSLNAEVKHFIDKNVNDADSDVTDVFVVGGTSSVSNSVQNSLVDMKLEVERLSGKERQETNAAVIDRFADESFEEVIVAKSGNTALVDALAAGALGAKKGSHIVLAGETLTDSQEDALEKANGTDTDVITSKVQAGYGIVEKVAKFIKGL